MVTLKLRLCVILMLDTVQLSACLQIGVGLLDLVIVLDLRWLGYHLEILLGQTNFFIEMMSFRNKMSVCLPCAFFFVLYHSKTKKQWVPDSTQKDELYDIQSIFILSEDFFGSPCWNFITGRDDILLTLYCINNKSHRLCSTHFWKNEDNSL